jgi:hypothetical protein
MTAAVEVGEKGVAGSTPTKRESCCPVARTQGGATLRGMAGEDH